MESTVTNMIAEGIENEEVTFTKTEGNKVKYWEYEYNLQGRLTKVYKNVDPDDKEDATPIAEFTYDTEGNRIKAVKRTPEGEKTTHFVYNQNGQVLVEKNITKEKFTSFVYAVGKKYVKVKGTIDDYLNENVEVGVVYYHHNNLGSTRVMTNQDGEKVFDQDYLPFGGDLPKAGQLEVQNETGESYKYTGQKQVASIGLYYYSARYYDPAIGRFTRQDSYRGKLKKPQSQHLYVYVLNNPLKYTDPTGHKNVKGADLDKESDSKSNMEKQNIDSKNNLSIEQVFQSKYEKKIEKQFDDFDYDSEGAPAVAQTVSHYQKKGEIKKQVPLLQGYIDRYQQPLIGTSQLKNKYDKFNADNNWFSSGFYKLNSENLASNTRETGLVKVGKYLGKNRRTKVSLST